jgi:hypothetical protein
VVELDLAEGLPRRREMVPQVKTFGHFRGFNRVAVSADHLIVAGHSDHLAWRSLEKAEDGRTLFTRKEFGTTIAFDLFGDKAVILGNPWVGVGPVPPGIVWMGSVSQELADLRPVLRDAAEEAGAPERDWYLFRCPALALGGVRFLSDGSFLVVPGFQPGATIYSANGQRARTWTSKQLGITTDDCKGLTRSESGVLQTQPDRASRWLAQHRVLEDILPLPQGPALVVRYRGADAKIHRELRLLRLAGGIESYAIPIEDDRGLGRIKGDVRDGKIVLLLYEMADQRGAEPRPDELFVAEIPGR